MRLFSRAARCLPLLLLSWLCLTLPALAQSPEVAQVNGYLKRAESNLKLVNDAIGHLTQPPKGSAGKLAKMRLEQAFGDLKPAGELLSKLKSGDGLAEATKRYNDDVALHDKLRGILTGGGPKPTPTPTPKPEPKPSSGGKSGANGSSGGEKPAAAQPATVKLGYPHADNFKNQLFTLRRVEGEAQGLVALLEELRGVEDPLSISYRRVAGALSQSAETRRQAGFVKDGLAKIPANGEGVAEAKQRLVNAEASLGAVEEFMKPLNARLAKLVDPASYPQFDADLKRLTELGSAYANPQMLFLEQRARAAEAFAQADVAKGECVRIAQAYARLIQQETDQGKRIEGAGNGFLRRHAEFLAAAEREREALPASIRADLAEADRMAVEAVQNQKPLWFTGGIPQRMEWVEDKFALYEVLDPKGAPAVGQEIAALEASLRERADALRELIIRENPLPEDRFAGADRDAAIAVAIDAWKIQEPDFELLATRIPSEAWSRETKWTYSNGTWYFSDRSTLQVRLIVADKQNPELAIDRPVNVRKDHQKGDTLIGVPMRSFDEALEPGEYLLRSRAK